MTDEAIVTERLEQGPPDESRPPRRRRRRRRRAFLAAAAIVAAGGVAAVATLGLGGNGNSGNAAAAGLPPSTAKVTKQTLKDTEEADGELGYGPTSNAISRFPGTITALPDSGATITRGKPLYRVDDKPVVLMYGSRPAYRPMKDGTEGKDVEQLEKNLSALGYDGFTVDDEYTSGTAAAVKEWQDDLGLEETGVVELGRVVFASGAIRVDSLEAGQGDPVAPGGKVLAYTGTAKAVTVELETSDRRLAKEGAPVEITLPGEETVKAKIDEVSTLIDPGDGREEEPSTKIEVVIWLTSKQAKDTDSASVDVAFTAETREDVLTVPVTALLALSEGGFGVEVVSGGRTSYVPVETGLFAAGRVEISGNGITEGTVVGVPK